MTKSGVFHKIDHFELIATLGEDTQWYRIIGF